MANNPPPSTMPKELTEEQRERIAQVLRDHNIPSSIVVVVGAYLEPVILDFIHQSQNTLIEQAIAAGPQQLEPTDEWNEGYIEADTRWRTALNNLKHEGTNQ